MGAQLDKRYLIVNADDFGQSHSVNRGIVETHEHGIVTSASLMVRWPAAADAAAYGRQHPELSVGLHLDIAEWAYRRGQWVALYQVVDKKNTAALAREINSQVESFRILMGRNPTHLDSHQHFHRDEPAQSIVLSLARAMAIPVRDFSPEVCYTGDFYGQDDEGLPYGRGITTDNLLGIVRGLTASHTELGCHPGYPGDLESMYLIEREQEVKTLCDPHLREAIQEMGVELVSFGDLDLASRRAESETAARR